ncbi:hypothetical protein HU200_030760 [Digitaria exilis]|uniref:Uncharacterized protein n=1 Tax=Digitaria exilis TaxID=1010633 RepID=A0A835BRA4_9POAL|nr:hypothetical protein HU200_030760 [Digitaria exilis]
MRYTSRGPSATARAWANAEEEEEPPAQWRSCGGRGSAATSMSGRDEAPRWSSARAKAETLTARRQGRRRPWARRRWRKPSEARREAKRRQTAGSCGSEARGTRARHSRRSSSGSAEMGDSSSVSEAGLVVVAAEMGTGTAMWRAGSAGMQDLGSHGRPRGWQLSAAMADREPGARSLAAQSMFTAHRFAAALVFEEWEAWAWVCSVLRSRLFGFGCSIRDG